MWTSYILCESFTALKYFFSSKIPYLIIVKGPSIDNSNGEPWYIDPEKEMT